MEKISYRELLDLIDESEQPQRVRLYLNIGDLGYKEYEWDYYSKCYLLLKEEDEDENFRFYLRDCLLDGQSFDKLIEECPATVESVLYNLKNKFYDLVDDIRTETNNKLSIFRYDTNEIVAEELVKLDILEQVINIVEEFE